MEYTINEVIAARIRHIRQKHNMSQNALGEKVGLGGTSISNYENKYSEPSMEILRKMADVFGVNISYFVDDGDARFEMPRLSQSGVVSQMMPYYKIDNVNGILLNDSKLSDGYVLFPWKDTYTNDIICTNIPDYAMAAAGFKQAEYIFVDTVSLPSCGDVSLIYDICNKKMLLRKYVTDGPMVMLVPDDYSKELPTIYTDKNDPDYQLIGPVVRWTNS
ncbi:MAG: helix-turn-helix transcriptional regulator [Clostridia bacterium]|nr:helix-turn-helix transcriptional regulator [Clostridia bacterium]